jgi:hypothetical protein
MHRGYARSRRPNTRVGVCELSWRGFGKEGSLCLFGLFLAQGVFYWRSRLKRGPKSFYHSNLLKC